MKGKKLLRDHIRAHWPYYAVAVTIMAAANIIYAFFPRVLGQFTDELELQGLTEQSVVKYSLLLLAIGVGYGLFFGIGQYINHRMGRYFEFNTRQKLFRHFTVLSEDYFSRNGKGKMLSYVMNDVTSVRESIANGVNQMTNASILLISVIVMISISGIPFSLLAISVAPLLSIPFLVIYFGPRIRERSKNVQESLAVMTESAEEQFGGIKVTKTFATEQIAHERFSETVDRIRANQLRLVKATSLFQSVLPFVGAMSMVVAITYGGILVSRSALSLGDFVAITLYLRMIMQPLQQIGNVINTIQRSRASLDRLNRLLSEVPDIREAAEATPLQPAATDIEIHGLSFQYPGANRPSLQDIHISIKAGSTLGIIGKTGSGKTTLMKLLLRVYDAPEHTIMIGGKDIRQITLESLRSQIAYVPQDGFLFSTTIRDNIAFYDRKASMERVEEAAKHAEIYENIVGFPKGFETRLGERGLTLSGGQRQRTSLARGMIKNAPILIMDDSVSAVDAVTETKIISNLKKLRQGKTTLLIAHRISAVKHADEIIVLDDGRITERGTHEELLRLGGYYASLHSIQEGDDSIEQQGG
ncbi:ABC transporter ATP-binding protein [Marinicrinis lubricantis]|uniref:ABC transporter ATP-binding protein n=1 Tax=Marinicrinis lubricantis TaxID=2086470 RepID=A0ABW1IL80_9BACL